MTSLTITLLTTIFLLLGQPCNAQTDTVVDGVQYNYVDYYSSGKIKSLGNYSDSLKTGPWTYFKPDGQTLARGKYAKYRKRDNGFKIGKWTYWDYDGRVYRKRWKRNNQPGEKLVIEDGKLYICDTTLKLNCLRGYRNGKRGTWGHI